MNLKYINELLVVMKDVDKEQEKDLLIHQKKKLILSYIEII